MNKFIYSLLCAAFTVFGGLSLVMAIHCFVTGSGKPGVWLAAFELTIMLTMIRHFGKARGRYEK